MPSLPASPMANLWVDREIAEPSSLWEPVGRNRPSAASPARVCGIVDDPTVDTLQTVARSGSEETRYDEAAGVTKVSRTQRSARSDRKAAREDRVDGG